MNRYSSQRAALAVVLLLSLGALATASLLQSQQEKPTQQPTQGQQPQGQQQQGQQPADQPKDALGGKNVQANSKNRGRDMASAGFKGVDPTTGKVPDTKLKEPATEADAKQAMKLSIYAVSDTAVQTFIQDGKLTTVASAKQGGK